MPSSLTSSISPDHLLDKYGLIGLAIIIFAETGLLIGFFLPGDSILFLAGAYAAGQSVGSTSTHDFNLGAVLVVVAVAALLGSQTGYFIGRAAGPRLFRRPDSKFFKQEYVTRTNEVVEKYGYVKALLISRFVPVVRTFINPMAGTIGVPVKLFTTWNVIGGLVWSLGVTLLGAALGKSIKNEFGSVDKVILPLTAIIVVLSVLPILLEVRKSRREKAPTG